MKKPQPVQYTQIAAHPRNEVRPANQYDASRPPDPPQLRRRASSKTVRGTGTGGGFMSVTVGRR